MKTTNAAFGIVIITMAVCVQVQAQSFLTNGLVAYYPFNGNANDESGNGHNGIVIGATLTSNQLGETNRAFLFDGVESAITVLDSAPLRLSGTDYTICAWVFETQRNEDYQDCILSKRGTGLADGWFLSIRGIKTSGVNGVAGSVYYQLSGGSDPVALSTSILYIRA